MNKYDRLSPEQAFAESANILSCTSPRHVWSLCALLSVADAFAHRMPEEFPFFPALNQEKIRMFCEATLSSKALDYKTRELNVDQVIEALNYANRALTDYESINLMTELKGLAGPELALRFFISRLGNIQLRYQDPRFHERIGRLIGMFEVLPQTHRQKMPTDFWTMANPVLNSIRDFLEFPILSLAGGVMALMELYQRPYQQIVTRYSKLAAGGTSQHECLRILLEERREYQPRFILPVELTVERSALDKFLELCARTTRELRELRQKDPVYRRGDVARRLSPLERFPVVLLSDREIVVPNVRYLYRNLPEIIHFSLWEAKIPRYDEVRGGLQELYLQTLIETRLPNVITIPERSYRRGKQAVKSADLTLVEHDRLIIIESKAQRIRAETRLNMSPENLLDNLGGAVGAIEKTEAKITELYAHIPEFADVQVAIDQTRNNKPIIVAVVGEDITMMGEVIRELERSYPNYPLAGRSGLHCILGIDAFERAVEVAATSGERLAALLEEYMREASSTRHDSNPADEFGGPIELVNTFAASFIHQRGE